MDDQSPVRPRRLALQPQLAAVRQRESQRARLLAFQGRLAEARSSLRKPPETEARDAVLKIQTEAQLLRELKQWREAWSVLEQGSLRFPEDPDLLYDQAMMAEKMNEGAEA